MLKQIKLSCCFIGLIGALAFTTLSARVNTAPPSSMSLTEALTKADCKLLFPAKKTNPAVTVLKISSATPCSNITVSHADATFSADSPLIPVVVDTGGTLTFKDEVITLYASSFLIKSGGIMQAGTVASPIENEIIFVMSGNSSASLAPIATGGTPIVIETNSAPNARDITVAEGGVLKLYGGQGISATPNGIDNDPATNPAFINTFEGTQSWTYLSAPAGPASYDDSENVSAPVPSVAPDKTLTLSTIVDWKIGDWISVATTSFSSHQTEIVQIADITSVANLDVQEVSITGASKTSPIVITTNAGKAPATGSKVVVSDVLGNTAANKNWTVTNLSPSTFSLNGSTGNAIYTSGGIWKMAASQIILENPLKHYHFGGLAPTPGFFPADTTQTVVTGGNAIDVSHQAKSFYDDSDRNYGIDERAEVALLSRNIKFTSVAGINPTTIANVDANFFGGHLAITSSSTNPSVVELVGVEIEKFGQPLVGRYPVHLHHLMDSGDQILIQDVSVHHSYNKCYVVHGTGKAKFYNNVCVRTVGQGVYLEDGDNIQGNQFMRNLIAGTMAASSTYSYPLQNGNSYWDGDNLLSTHTAEGQITNATQATTSKPIIITSSTAVVTGDQISISGVLGNTAANGQWTVTNINATSFSLNGSIGSTNSAYTGGGDWATPNWYNINNIPDTSYSGSNAIGTYNYGPDQFHPGGFWITNLDNTFVNNSVAGCQAQGRGYWLLAQGDAKHAYPEFVGNRVHGCYNGIDTQPDAVNNVFDPKPTMSGTGNSNAPVFLLNDNTITRSRQRGFWGRGLYFALHNNRFATNPYGFSLLGGGGPEGNLPGFWGLAHDNVIAGMTRNNVERYPGCTYGNVPGLTPAILSWQTECTDVALVAASAGWGNYPSAKMNIQGYSYYDGPARLEHNRFVNFRHDPTGIHSTNAAARLLTATDIQNIESFGLSGQLEAPMITTSGANAAPSVNYQGYAGDPATGWIQSNQQAVPPTQYIQNSIWDNVDFKHQVYSAAVNMGPFNDGDKNTVIRDKDGELSGYKVQTTSGDVATGVVPTSLNNLAYFATQYTIDEPHSRGVNNFRESSLMSPHKYATLNIESVINPPNTTASGQPTTFRVEIKRDMPAYGDTNYPSQFLNGRGQNPIYEPFVMDRMGYTLYGKSGTENLPSTQLPTAFRQRLLFSYTDAAVKNVGDYFVNRIAVHQDVATPGSINIYRIRRQWGQNYTGVWPPNFTAPGGAANSCDGVFFENQPYADARWQDCLNRGQNVLPNTGGVALTQAADWKTFESNYKGLLAGTTTVTDFIGSQTYYYDTTNKLLYFYMIENNPVNQLPSPYGTCGGGKTTYAANIKSIQNIKKFSDQGSIQAALDAACLAVNKTPQATDLFSCSEAGCVAYAVDFTESSVVKSAPDSGKQIVVSGVKGNTGANGTWTVTQTSRNTFILNGSNGNSDYTSGGTWQSVEAKITQASKQTPIIITTSQPAPPTGTHVTVTGVLGNTAANGNWVVTNTGSNTFALNSSVGNAAFVSGGTWQTQAAKIGYATNSNLIVIGSEKPCSACAPANPITLSDYSEVNQYQLAYSTPTQQPNGLPVVENLAIGNTPPPPTMTITHASNKQPISITSIQSAPKTGDIVSISGVKGNTAANGTWTVINTGSHTFTLDTSAGNAVYTSGGTWQPAVTSKYPLNDESPSEGGNQITYSFLPLSGSPVPLTQDFPYRCTTMPPWSPVNARGIYPADDEKFSLVKNICELDK